MVDNWEFSIYSLCFYLPCDLGLVKVKLYKVWLKMLKKTYQHVGYNNIIIRIIINVFSYYVNLVLWMLLLFATYLPNFKIFNFN
jgi:hypothetical protein